MEAALVILGVPLGAALVAGVPLHFFSSGWLIRIWNSALAAQAALVASAWLLLAAAPDVPNWNSSGSTCPDLGGAVGDVVVGVGFGSIAVGAVCLAAAVLTAHRRASGVGRVLGGLAASAAPLAVFVPLLFAAFCGWN
jgi:hypothetical protein